MVVTRGEGKANKTGKAGQTYGDGWELDFLAWTIM